MAKYRKAILALLFFAATATEAVTAAHGFTWVSVGAIATAAAGILGVHQVPNALGTP